MSQLNKSMLLQALRANIEGCVTECDSGERWADVYLPNVGNTLQFAGLLSVLKKEGFYKPVDTFFGQVKLN